MNRLHLLALLPLFVIVGCETTEPQKRNFISSYRGMKAESGGLLTGNVMVREGDPKALQRYTKVIIEDVKVIPSKSTHPNRPPVSRAESAELANTFEKILAKELSQHYQITNRRGSNTMAVRAALTEMQPSNPALFAVNYLPYAGLATTGVKLATGETPGAGSTTFEAEVVDSQSRRQLYAIVDQIKGSKLHPSGLEKWGQTEQAMRIWSKKIRTGIQANATTTTATPSKRPETKSKPATVAAKKTDQKRSTTSTQVGAQKQR